jgi:aminodeoxychorismate lyase
MQVFLNGQFVSEDQAYVSVFDRGFLYGDALFETLRVYGGTPFRWTQHLERLRHGAEYLRLRVPYTPAELRAYADDLILRNATPDGILRITLTRGVGPRGYSPKWAAHPFLAMDVHPAPALDFTEPPGWRVIVSSIRVPANDPLATFKTANKLHQVLAHAEAEAQGADTALLLNTNGDVAEAANSNAFWIESGTVCTTPVASGVLPGIARALVLDLCPALSLACAEKNINAEALKTANGVFLTLSTLEIVEVISLDGTPLKRSPIVDQIRRAYREVVVRETAE